jgi:hypothetical protein
LEEGEGEPLMLLHGLFGALSNFADLVEHFRHTHKVIVPLLMKFQLLIMNNSIHFFQLVFIGYCLFLHSVDIVKLLQYAP